MTRRKRNPKPPPPQHGSSNGRSTLSERDVLRIRALGMRVPRVPRMEIAQRLKCHVSTVYLILSGKRRALRKENSDV